MIERANAAAALAEIVSLVSDRLPTHYEVDPVRDIQVFAPVYRGELGIDAINAALRAALNPDGKPVRGGRLRIGDKLMMTGRNLHELGLMNGTLLRLLDEVTGGDPDEDDEDDEAPGSSGRPRRDDPALVLAADDAVFRLAPEESDSLRLAYACSVHRGQGIELPIAVIVAHPACGAFFLRREMLYTAVTRATIATVIVGTRGVLARAVATPDTGRRYGRLGERLDREPARSAQTPKNSISSRETSSGSSCATQWLAVGTRTTRSRLGTSAASGSASSAPIWRSRSPQMTSVGAVTGGELVLIALQPIPDRGPVIAEHRRHRPRL